MNEAISKRLAQLRLDLSDYRAWLERLRGNDALTATRKSIELVIMGIEAEIAALEAYGHND